MWDLFRAGIEPVSLELQAGFLTTGPPVGLYVAVFVDDALQKRKPGATVRNNQVSG